MRTAAFNLGPLGLAFARDSQRSQILTCISQVPSIAMVAMRWSCQYRILYLTPLLNTDTIVLQ